MSGEPPISRGTNGAVDLGRPRSVNEVIEAAVDCYRAYPWLFATLALGVVVPYGMIVRLAEGSSLLGARHGAAGTQLTLTLVDLLIVGPLISALHIHALVLIGDGRRPALGTVARRGIRVIPIVAAAEIVAGLGIVAGLVLLIVPGIVLSLRWAVVAQTAAVEQVSWLGALRRSGELTDHNYRHVFGLIALVTLFGAVFTSVVGVFVGHGAGPVQVVIGIFVETFTRSLAALTTAVLYFDLLARHTRGTELTIRTSSDIDPPANSEPAASDRNYPDRAAIPELIRRWRNRRK